MSRCLRESLTCVPGSPTSSATTSTTRHAILAISWCGANSGSRELLRAVLIGAGCSLFACTDVEGFYFCRSNGLFSETLRTILAPHAYLPRLLGRDDERKLFEGGVPGAAKGDGETALMENGEDGHQFVWGALRECGGAVRFQEEGAQCQSPPPMPLLWGVCRLVGLLSDLPPDRWGGEGACKIL